MQIKNHILRLLNNYKIIVLICLFLIAIVAIIVKVKILHFWEYNTEGQDVYYGWIEGKRLLAGENPYARVLAGNMRDNHKYATYFPLFYLFSSLVQLLGFKEYSSWISIWQPIFLIFDISIAGLLFYQFSQQKLIIFGLFAALFWLFNRWTLHVNSVAHLDFIPIFFLILSLMLFQQNRYISFLLFGLSLSFKQIAIFLLPLYLIWTWNSAEENKLKDVFRGLLLILVIPLITSLPFIVWNAQGFVKSILFSATRKPDLGHVSAGSIDALISLNHPDFIGIKAKFIMLLMMSLVFLSAFKRQIGIYSSVLLIMAVFIDFNSVLFLQYFCWVVPFISLSIGEMMTSNGGGTRLLKN